MVDESATGSANSCTGDVRFSRAHFFTLSSPSGKIVASPRMRVRVSDPAATHLAAYPVPVISLLRRQVPDPAGVEVDLVCVDA